MRALCWHGKNDVRVDTVPDPKIQEPTDVIIKITSTAICGSDLHLYDGFMMGMEKGDVLGHEPMGIVVEVGSSVRKLKKGDRVVVPFVIACGHCFFCTKQLYSVPVRLTHGYWRPATRRDLGGQFRSSQAAGVSSAIRLIGKFANPGKTEAR